jgi:hypothetical protein
MNYKHITISFVCTLAIHAAFIIFLTSSVTPNKKPLQTPDVKTSKLNVTPYEVKKSQSDEMETSAEKAKNNKLSETKAAQGVVKVSKTNQKKPDSNKLKANNLKKNSEKSSQQALPNSMVAKKKIEPNKIKLNATLSEKIKPNLSKVKKAVIKEIKNKPTLQTTNFQKIKLEKIDLKPKSLKKINNSVSLAPTIIPVGTLASEKKLSTNKAPLVQNNATKVLNDKVETETLTENLAPNPDIVETSKLNSNNISETKTNVFSEQLNTKELPSTFAVAGLAWTGENNNQNVDPTSLAAIQAFVQVGDLNKSQSNVGEVRDGISQTLETIPCSRVQAQFIPQNGTLQLNGHIPDEGLREPVIEAMQKQMGKNINVVDNMLILPRPQCGIISAIAAVGLPQSTDQLTNPLLIGEDAHVKEYNYKEGERLKLDMTAPHYDSFIYVDYFDATGMVLHLQPNDIIPLNLQMANSNLSVGKETNGKPSLKIMIAPPFGQEIAVAFASSVNLYAELRPTIEPAQNYLIFLKTKIEQARLKQANFKGEWVYFFIETSQ